MQGPVGIIGAMSIEIDLLISQMNIEKQEKIASQIFYVGMLQGVSCVISKCGPGKVNAAVCAQTMILTYHPRLIINSGVAGGLASDMDIGDFVVADHCVQHDCDTTALGDPPGLISGLNIVKVPCDPRIAEVLRQEAESIYGSARIGTIATGDIFLQDRKRAGEIRETYGALACEMEGGSIAHVCYMNAVPVAVLRSISDKGDDDSQLDYTAFAQMSAQRIQKLLTAVIDRL